MFGSQTVVVAGNGPSLADVTPGQVLTTDKILRTNNFFFEPDCFLGPKVDVAFLGGDPRAAPFMVATLEKAKAHYDVKAWCARDPRVVRQARRFLKSGAEIKWNEPDPEIADLLGKICQKYQRQPLTGTYALIFALNNHAQTVVLAGMDLYVGSTRYSFVPGRNQRSLLGNDIGSKSHDARLHDPDLDRDLITTLAEIGERHGTGRIFATGAGPLVGQILNDAPIRDLTLAIHPTPKPLIADWEGRAGLVPVRAVGLLRKFSNFAHRVGLREKISGPQQEFMPKTGPSPRKDRPK